jgi:outer membrane protein assembly factor BamB
MHALALGLFLLAPPTADTANWPQWRGPTGDSVYHGTGLPTQWGPENVVWKATVPGWGASTPAVWGDHLFVTTQLDDRDLMLVCLHARTGKKMWQQKVAAASPRRKGPVGEGRFMDEHNMASPSPVTDGKHVWVHFGSGDLACYDFSGAKVWGVNLKERYGPYTIWWGHANSPVLFGDLIITVCMQDPKGGGKSYVAAFDKLTGKEKWYTDRTTGAKEEPGDSYTTPLLYKNGDRTELIVFGGNVLDAYDPATGERMWENKVFEGNRVISGPTLAGDTVYAVQGMRGPLFAIKAGGTGDVTKTHVRWAYKGGTPDASTPVYCNGLVFMATNPGAVVCVDAQTGKEQWKERLSSGFRATPLVSDGKIFFFGKDGRATVVEASPSFHVVGRSDLGEDITASPAAVSGDLIIRTKTHLYRIGAKR